MKLRDLDAQFYHCVVEQRTWRRIKAGVDLNGPFKEDGSDSEVVTGPRFCYMPVDSLAAANGIWFLCPFHFSENLKAFGDGKYGTEMIAVGFAGRDAPPGSYTQNKEGQDTRWNVAGGTGYDDLVLTPSIQVLEAPTCTWHGFVGSNGVPPGEAA